MKTSIKIESREKILAELDNHGLKHGHDSDIAEYSDELRGRLFMDDYIEYGIDKHGVHWKWTEGALDILNKGIRKPEDIPITEVTVARDDMELKLHGAKNKDGTSITIIPSIKCGNKTHRFSEYALKLTKTDQEGIYELYASCPKKKSPKYALCVFANTSAQLNHNNAKEICWDYENDHTFKCKELGITICLCDEMGINDMTALRVVLETDTTHEDTMKYTLMTLTTDGILNSANYMVNRLDPLVGMWTEHYIESI